MPLRPAGEPLVLGKVPQPEWAVVAGQCSQEASADGRRPETLRDLGRHAGVDEPLQATAVREDRECRVVGLHKYLRPFCQPAEHIVEAGGVS